MRLNYFGSPGAILLIMFISVINAVVVGLSSGTSGTAIYIHMCRVLKLPTFLNDLMAKMLLEIKVGKKLINTKDLERIG